MSRSLPHHINRVIVVLVVSMICLAAGWEFFVCVVVLYVAVFAASLRYSHLVLSTHPTRTHTPTHAAYPTPITYPPIHAIRPFLQSNRSRSNSKTNVSGAGGVTPGSQSNVPSQSNVLSYQGSRHNSLGEMDQSVAEMMSLRRDSYLPFVALPALPSQTQMAQNASMNKLQPIDEQERTVGSVSVSSGRKVAVTTDAV